MSVVIITGGSQGIGAACVFACANAGYNVVFSYLNDDPGKSMDWVRNNTSSECICVESDCSRPESSSELVEKAKALGPIAGVVINAGICEPAAFFDVSAEQYRKHMAVNADGGFFLAQAAAAEMIKEKVAGSIVFVSSISAMQGGEWQAHYGASKAAQIGIAKSAAVSLGKYGIRVNAVAPGSISTRLNKTWERTEAQKNGMLSRIPLGRFGEPADVAGLVAFLLSDAARYITGACIPVDGGWSAKL